MSSVSKLHWDWCEVALISSVLTCSELVLCQNCKVEFGVKTAPMNLMSNCVDGFGIKTVSLNLVSNCIDESGIKLHWNLLSDCIDEFGIKIALISFRSVVQRICYICMAYVGFRCGVFVKITTGLNFSYKWSTSVFKFVAKILLLQLQLRFYG